MLGVHKRFQSDKGASYARTLPLNAVVGPTKVRLGAYVPN